jgi:plasmid stabilization system protein ParE
MTLGFDFHPEARAEFLADVDWYDEREMGVGERFEAAVRAAIDAAVDSPESWSVWAGWEREPVVRSKGVSGFPYRVVYFVRDDLLTIVAVAHVKRRPGYWRERVAST